MRRNDTVVIIQQSAIGITTIIRNIAGFNIRTGLINYRSIFVHTCAGGMPWLHLLVIPRVYENVVNKKYIIPTRRKLRL